MGALRDFANRYLGYDAVISKAHRRSTPSVTQSEDRELTKQQRRKLIAGTRDIRRNFEIAAWAIRKHLDYVSSFSFRSTSGNPDWDKAVQALITRQSKPENCDAAGKKSLRKLIRLAEALRTVDGDTGLLKLNSRQIQIIEGDRIKNPPTEGNDLLDDSRWTHGVKTNKQGRALAYGIHTRRGQSLHFERTIASSQMYLHGYYDRADQVRGISPVAASLNRMQDTYEGLNHSLAKAKTLQLLGLVLNRQVTRADEWDTEDDCEDIEDALGDFNLDPSKGPFTLDLGPEDKASLLQTNHPNNEFQAFMQMCISIALKSLDLPYFFFDESKLNFFGGKVALSNYLISCNDKRQDNIDLLVWWTRWQVGTAIARGELNPADYGLTWEDIDGSWRWIPRGIPWWDKGREITGDILSINAGLEDRSSIIESRTGNQFEDVADRLREEQDYLQAKGVIVSGPKDLLDFAMRMNSVPDQSGSDSE